MNEEDRIKSFTDLIVWQKAHRLVLLIYVLTKEFLKEETYSLVDQMRRAVVSITSNISEAFGRRTFKEKAQFYHMASGSLYELKNQIIIARDLGYMVSDRELFDLCNEVHRLLNGIISSSKRKIPKR